MTCLLVLNIFIYHTMTETENLFKKRRKKKTTMQKKLEKLLTVHTCRPNDNTLNTFFSFELINKDAQ